MKRVRVKIFGEVQGVFFRANTKEKADELGIKGWVRNLPDMCVEALFEGEDSKVNEIINWCRKGPIGARVDRIEVKEEKFRDEFKKIFSYLLINNQSLTSNFFVSHCSDSSNMFESFTKPIN